MQMVSLFSQNNIVESVHVSAILTETL